MTAPTRTLATVLLSGAVRYSQLGGLSSPAETFMLDGKQHLLFTGANGLLYLFVLNQPRLRLSRQLASPLELAVGS